MISKYKLIQILFKGSLWWKTKAFYIRLVLVHLTVESLAFHTTSLLTLQHIAFQWNKLSLESKFTPSYIKGDHVLPCQVRNLDALWSGFRKKLVLWNSLLGDLCPGSYDQRKLLTLAIACWPLDSTGASYLVDFSRANRLVPTGQHRQ